MSLREDTLAHYDRMIRFVEDEMKKGDANIHDVDDYYVLMEEAIGESWYGSFCPLCNRYCKREDFIPVCNPDCPVVQRTQLVGCANTPWMYIHEATSWDELLTALQKERDFLSALSYPFTEQILIKGVMK